MRRMTRTRVSGRLVLGLAAVAVLAVAFGTIHFTRPRVVRALLVPARATARSSAATRTTTTSTRRCSPRIYQESKFKANARSDRGAVGLMQLLPATAKGIAARTGGSKFQVSDLYDPEINIRYGAWYLRHLLDKYHSERTALAAYNAGQANVDSWRNTGDRRSSSRRRRDFVARVESLKKTYRHAYSSLRQQRDT